MRNFILTCLTLSHDKRAVTALEYGLIAAVVGGAIATGFSTFGTNLGNALSALKV